MIDVRAFSGIGKTVAEATKAANDAFAQAQRDQAGAWGVTPFPHVRTIGTEDSPSGTLTEVTIYAQYQTKGMVTKTRKAGSDNG